MLRGLGRAPFGPRTSLGQGAGAPAPEAPDAAEATPQGPASPPVAPPTTPAPPPAPAAAPSPPPRPIEAVKEPDAAQVQFETLKRHIHMRLVDRLDMNRIAEIDPKLLRNEIKGVVETLCDTENPLLNRNERQRLVLEILDETFGFGPL